MKDESPRPFGRGPIEARSPSLAAGKSGRLHARLGVAPLKRYLESWAWVFSLVSPRPFGRGPIEAR